MEQKGCHDAPTCGCESQHGTPTVELDKGVENADVLECAKAGFTTNVSGYWVASGLRSRTVLNDRCSRAPMDTMADGIARDGNVNDSVNVNIVAPRRVFETGVRRPFPVLSNPSPVHRPASYENLHSEDAQPMTNQSNF